MVSFIQVRGAREHNLKNINVSIPKNKLVVITGLSGSGKSSLAFDTIYAEGQRRYVESLSAYARQFLELMKKPDVDSIEGLAPAIAIEQKTTSKNPRSTVGTVTEIYDYLRLLYSRIGVPHSPATGLPIQSQTVTQMVDAILSYPVGAKLLILSPIIRGRKGEYQKELNDLKKQGFARVIIDDQMYEFDDLPKLNKKIKHTIEVVVDRIVVKADIGKRLADSVETALNLSEGLLYVKSIENDTKQLFSAKFSCPESGFTLDELEPRLFSFNSPYGACDGCDGLGVKISFSPNLIVPDHNKSIYEGAILPWSGSFSEYYNQALAGVIKHYGDDPASAFKDLSDVTKQAILYGSKKESISYEIKDSSRSMKHCKPFEGVIPTLTRRLNERDKQSHQEEMNKFQSSSPCEKCHGERLRPEALCVKINTLNISQICNMSIFDSFAWFNELGNNITTQQHKIADKVIKELHSRLHFLVNVGVGYLHLSRNAGTLSGGESQRIRLASQIGSGLTGVLYVLDEPSIGLHQRDNDRLLDTLRHLRDLENTVIVVEHDEDAIRSADHIIDMGPGAGVFGGEIVAQGCLEEILQSDSVTAQYLTRRKVIPVPQQRRAGDEGKYIKIFGASAHNLKNVTVEIPLGKMVCVTGVSGSGKSSLVIETLYKALCSGKNHLSYAAHCQNIEGLDLLDKVIDIDQSPIGRTPRSNPATYTGLFTAIRDWFASLPDAQVRGYKAGRFSFNVKGGRCEACQGDGVIKIEMHFLPDVYVTCEQCAGKRYNRETLDVKFKNHSIADVLSMSVDEGVEFFSALPSVREKLSMLQQVGLGYVQIGQRATTLSGGEAQRVKLAKELAKRSTGKTIYILDEPTTGLHFEDIKKLLEVLHALVDQGNTVVVIEHNLDVIKTADWIIDMGPEGGDGGGCIIAQGTPEDIASCGQSYTGKYLKPYL